MSYETLLKPFEYYLLPDGTDAQAIWTGDDPIEGDTTPPFWILVPGDNPRDRDAWRMQYEIQRDGRIMAVRYAGEQPGDLGELPKAERIEQWMTDLTIDDLRPEAKQ